MSVNKAENFSISQPLSTFVVIATQEFHYDPNLSSRSAHEKLWSKDSKRDSLWLPILIGYVCSRVTYPFVFTHFWDLQWGVPFSACRKRECCLRIVNKAEIHLSKIGLVDSKGHNLNGPTGRMPLSSLCTCILRLPCLRGFGISHYTFRA